MKVYPRCTPKAVDSRIQARIEHDITLALNSIVTVGMQFVVNDSTWFSQRPNGKVTPAVMNMAKFISGGFQNSLRDFCGWKKDFTISEQEIDAFVELDAPGNKLRIPPDATFLDYFRRYIDSNPTDDLRKEFIRCWHLYVRVGINSLSEVDQTFRSFFGSTGRGSAKIRVGLEFETGNIASSFRALGKLETLFVTEQIDYGVFITSIDKENAAARIWPQSNRNGSFTELEKRNYRNNLTVPLWEFGFAPDEFDRAAQFFDNKVLYSPVATGESVEFAGHTYDVFTRGQERLLKPR